MENKTIQGYNWGFTVKKYDENKIETIKNMVKNDTKTFREMAFQSNIENGEKILRGAIRTNKIRLETLNNKITIEGMEIYQKTMAKGEKIENVVFVGENYDTETKIRYRTEEETTEQNKTQKAVAEIKEGKKGKDELIRDNAEVVMNKGVQFEKIYKSNMKNRTGKTKTIIYFGALEEHIDEIKKKYSEDEEEFYVVQQGRKGEVWFDNYDQEKITILMDYSGYMDIRVLTQMMGKGKMQVNVKGSSVKYNSEYLLIFCTSFKNMMMNWYPNASSTQIVNLLGKIDEAYKVDIDYNINDKMESIKKAIGNHKKIISEEQKNDDNDEEIIKNSIKQTRIMNKSKMEKEMEKNEIEVVKKEIKNAERAIQNTNLMLGHKKAEKIGKEIDEMMERGMQNDEIQMEIETNNEIERRNVNVVKSMIMAKKNKKKMHERANDICGDKNKARTEISKENGRDGYIGSDDEE